MKDETPPHPPPYALDCRHPFGAWGLSKVRGVYFAFFFLLRLAKPAETIFTRPLMTRHRLIFDYCCKNTFQHIPHLKVCYSHPRVFILCLKPGAPETHASAPFYQSLTPA